MSEKNPKYTPEFKQTIVNLYHSGKTYNQIKEEEDSVQSRQAVFVRCCLNAVDINTCDCLHNFRKNPLVKPELIARRLM